MPINPSSCIACRLPRHECVCAVAPRLRIATRLFVIIHSKEWRKTTNTGHLARLAIENGVVRRHGLPHRTVSSDGVDAASPSTLVLFPGHGARPLTAELIAPLPRPLTLLVPDGNWNQTQHMMRRVPMLSRARPVRLAGSSFHDLSLRRNCRDGRMSTFEAIAQALGILEGPEAEEQLLTFFRLYLNTGMHHTRRGARRGPRAASSV
jgi:DTW domain-containing protein YfiP